MTYDRAVCASLDYFPCRYGGSRLIFRGPPRPVEGGHLAVLGGTESYGRFMETPWPALLEPLAGAPVANLAQPNAGVDVFLNDPAVLDICRRARATVIELTGPQNLSNRLYAVHPRRNDRFLRASARLQALFPEVDFAVFNFTGHLIRSLTASGGGARLAELAAELRAAWVARMSRLVAAIEGPVVLLRLSGPPQARAGSALPRLDAAAVAALRPRPAGLVEIEATPQEIARGRDRMVFDPAEAPAAAQLLGPEVHRRAAGALAEALRRL